MTKYNAKENIEDIMNDIKSLIKNLSKLKENSSGAFAESFEDMSGVISKIKGSTIDNLPSKNKLVYEGINYMYGSTIKKAITIIGVTALLAYLANR